ncbi:zinc finger, CCHC-type containing protein [Tanacetum coccineum]
MGVHSIPPAPLFDEEELFDIYQFHGSAKELGDSLESKYMAEDASSKKFIYGKTGHMKRDCKGVKIGNKTNGSSTSGSKNGSNNHLKGLSDGLWGEAMEIVRLPDPNMKTLKERVNQGLQSMMRIDSPIYLDQVTGFQNINGTGDDIGVSEVFDKIALASIHNLNIYQMDVKTTFLNGELDEEVYMNQPWGFTIFGNENKVFKLVKSLYGLKQAPKQCHLKFDEVVLSSGYLLNLADNYVYSKFDESGVTQEKKRSEEPCKIDDEFMRRKALDDDDVDVLDISSLDSRALRRLRLVCLFKRGD